MAAVTGAFGSAIAPIVDNIIRGVTIIVPIAIACVLLFLFRDKIGRGRPKYNVKVTIYQLRSDGWKKFFTKGAYLTDVTTGLEYFKVKNRKLPQKPPVLNRLTKANEAEFFESEVGELYPLYTTIQKEQILMGYDKLIGEDGKPILDADGKEQPDKTKPIYELQYKKVLDPDITETRAFQSLFMLESKKQFSPADWFNKYGNMVITWSAIICLVVVMLMMYQTFSHPIVLQVSGVAQANVVQPV